MKVGIVGKGGVGKTTVSALLTREYARRGQRVVAIDTDSNPNLGMSLGLGVREVDTAPELPRALVVGTGGDGATAASVLADYGVATPSGATLLTAMRVDEAGAGCTCASHATVRSLLGEALDEQAEVTVIDMEAGLEHLSRAGGTLAHADVLLVVMEPSRKSVITAARTVTLAEELGLSRVYGVGNKAATAADRDFFAEACADYGVPLAAVLPYDAGVAAADRVGDALAEPPPEVAAAIEQVMAVVDGAPVA